MSTMGSRVAGLLLVFLGLLVLAQQTQAMNVIVRAGKETCFIEDLQQYDRMKTSFVVISGGASDVDMAVYGPEGDVVFQQDRVAEGNFQFAAHTSGIHRLCFNNKMSTISNKVISFNIYVGEKLHHLESATGAGVNKVESGVTMLQENLYSVRDSTDYLRYRQIRCAQTAQSTNTRIFWWKVTHTLVLLGAAGLQVLYITSLFTRGKGLGAGAKGLMSSAASAAASGFAAASFGSSSAPGSSMLGSFGPASGALGGGLQQSPFGPSPHEGGLHTRFAGIGGMGGAGGGGYDSTGGSGAATGGPSSGASARFSALGGNPFD